MHSNVNKSRDRLPNRNQPSSPLSFCVVVSVYSVYLRDACDFGGPIKRDQFNLLASQSRSEEFVCVCCTSHRRCTFCSDGMRGDVWTVWFQEQNTGFAASVKPSDKSIAMPRASEWALTFSNFCLASLITFMSSSFLVLANDLVNVLGLPSPLVLCFELILRRANRAK